MNSCSYFERNPAFISSSSSRNEQYDLLTLCLLLGVSMSTRLTWLFTYEMRVLRGGGIALEIMSWTGKTEHRVVSYGLLHHLMFVFESRHFKLSIDTTPMSVC